MRGRRPTAGPTGNVVGVSDDIRFHDQIDERFDDELGDAVPDDVPEPAEPAEPELARWELPGPTDVLAVDDALAPLVELDDLPTGEHVAYYEAVHRRLQDALADLDSA